MGTAARLTWPALGVQARGYLLYGYIYIYTYIFYIYTHMYIYNTLLYIYIYILHNIYIYIYVSTVWDSNLQKPLKNGSFSRDFS